AHLVRGDVGQLGTAVPDVHAPEAGHRVEVFGAVGIDDGRAAALDDHERLGFELPVSDDRMQHVVEVLSHDGRAAVDVRGAGACGLGHRVLSWPWIRPGLYAGADPDSADSAGGCQTAPALRGRLYSVLTRKCARRFLAQQA